jgi:signal transduction histidine kinase
LAGQDSSTHEFRVRRADGEFREVIGRSIAERAADGTLLSIVGTVQDITDSKRQEAILREAMNNAETANRAKTKFLAAMSHELRTPLNAILGFAELLSLRTQGELTPAQASYVANIIQGGEHLLHLINDVLDLARIDTGKLMLNVDRVEVDALICDVIEDFRPMADARGVTLRFAPCADGPVIAKADRIRLTQVLVNLASNAIKYNRPQGTVAFHLQIPRPGRVRLAVEDTGRGIPSDRHPEVFESFNRLGAEATGEEGTGIGLSLSKRLVEEMGGSIGFHSAPGTGSMFWVDLPDIGDIDTGTIGPRDARTLAG